MHIQRTRGFTLIELLVVIAIIGILSAVVLASLNNARSKGNDAAVKSNMNNMRGQAELFYSENGNVYVVSAGGTTDVCSLSANVSGVKGIGSFGQAAAAATGVSYDPVLTNNGTTAKASCHSTATAWGMEAPLRGNYPPYTNPMWCVDSTGKATTTTGSTLAASDPVCN